MSKILTVQKMVHCVSCPPIPHRELIPQSQTITVNYLQRSQEVLDTTHAGMSSITLYLHAGSTSGMKRKQKGGNESATVEVEVGMKLE